MAQLCVKMKRILKKKAQEKTLKETKRITCSFLAFWMTMESYEVPFKEMLTHDFSYQGGLFYNDVNVDRILSAGYWKSKKYIHHYFLNCRCFFLCP